LGVVLSLSGTSTTDLGGGAGATGALGGSGVDFGFDFDLPGGSAFSFSAAFSLPRDALSFVSGSDAGMGASLVGLVTAGVVTAAGVGSAG